jgi:hypothetical protein
MEMKRHADSGITRPKELSGKRYASYGARYEGRIVQQMIINDGGDGEYIEDTTMGMLDVWQSLLTGKSDATWVFMAWEGVLAKLAGVELNVFQLDDYKVCKQIYSSLSLLCQERHPMICMQVSVDVMGAVDLHLGVYLKLPCLWSGWIQEPLWRASSSDRDCIALLYKMVCYGVSGELSDAVCEQVPYGYSPVLAVLEETLPGTEPLIAKFLEASAQGWHDFVDDPKGCAIEVCVPLCFPAPLLTRSLGSSE